jgi:hypothetical protein
LPEAQQVPPAQQLAESAEPSDLPDELSAELSADLAG